MTKLLLLLLVGRQARMRKQLQCLQQQLIIHNRQSRQYLDNQQSTAHGMDAADPLLLRSICLLLSGSG